MSATDSASGGGASNSLPMSVHNVGFLLDRLGQDCSPLQYLRELTQNAIEAIGRTGSDGEVIWDLDWITYDLTNEKQLCVIDTGDGMTGEEMLKFINQLSSSGSTQSMSANFGIGAKIAAATKNPKGVVYHSWKNGEGNMVQLEKDPITQNYGLVQWELEDGSYSHVLPLDDDVKPSEIDEHGTKVILYGTESNPNTMEAPDVPGGVPSPSRWISKYLNTRYLKFPAGVKVKVREGWDHPRDDTNRNILRSISGQRDYLDKHAVSSGVQHLSSALVHWWILRDEQAIGQNSGFIESGGHTAALYQDELYDRSTARAATARLQNFGILFGMRFVVLYVKPIEEEDEALTTNTARTTLLLNGESLPWADWAHEFRENMPAKLADFVKEKAAAGEDNDHLTTIKDRLKNVFDLYRVSRYRPTPTGVYLSDPQSAINGGTSPGSGRKSSKSGGGKGASVGTTSFGSRDGAAGNIYHLFQKKGGETSDEQKSDPFPQVKWVSIKDGTREETDMEDRAGKYLANQNMLLINSDFRVFTDMIARLCKDKAVSSGVQVEGVVTQVVRAWFEQALIETVIGITQLNGSKEWGRDSIDAALSEEALTTAVMQRYHIYNSCKRELGSKLGASHTAKT